MKYLKYLAIGILFGIVMTKSEAVSWYRMQEMFRFQSFHMFGIIGTTVAVGVFITALIKKLKIKALDGSPITFKDKQFSIPRYLFGGIVFGLGWAISGACPGPMFTLVGNGFSVILVMIFSAMLGTLTYGLVRSKLPH